MNFITRHTLAVTSGQVHVLLVARHSVELDGKKVDLAGKRSISPLAEQPNCRRLPTCRSSSTHRRFTVDSLLDALRTHSCRSSTSLQSSEPVNGGKGGKSKTVGIYRSTFITPARCFGWLVLGWY